MTTYLCVEIDGDARSGAHLTAELRQGHEEVLVDRRGFLLIPDGRWEALQQLAALHHCELRLVERSREAA
jgi:hypothetical protein